MIKSRVGEIDIEGAPSVSTSKSKYYHLVDLIIFVKLKIKP